MSLTLRLTARSLLARRVRTVLTILAIAFAVSLVVAVTSGFSSLTAVALRLADRVIGSTDIFITAREVQRTTFPDSVLTDVRADPRVKKALGRFETPVPFLDTAGKVVIGRNCWLVGLTPPQDSGGANLNLVAGSWFSGDTGDVVVLNSVAARVAKSPNNDDPEAPSLGVGDNFVVPGPNGPLTLKVVGIVHQPSIAGPNAYLPLETLRRWSLPGKPPVLSRVLVELKSGDDLQKFADDWTPKLKAADPNIRLRLARTSKDQLENNLMGLTMLSAMGVSVSLVAAGCIVFSTLSMGVAERQRQLAMLRAIGALRGQIARLVVAEGLLLSVLGVAVGVPLGWLFVKALTLYYSAVFTEGVVLSYSGASYALIACVATALVATILPAWQATRVSPLEAMSQMAEVPAHRWPWRLALAGLACILIAPLNLSGFTPAVLHATGLAGSEAAVRGVQFYGHFVVAVPLTMVGFFMLSPMAVRLVESALVPLAAVVMRLPVAILRQQLAGGLWRAAGTACALMVGLATLVVMQVQGASALGAWKLPSKFPDIFILHRGLGGLDPAQVDRLAATPGIRKGELMAVAIASPQFGNNFLAIAGAAMLPDSTLFFGLDPELASKMTELEFRQGTPAEAVRLLRTGRHVLITEEFRQVRGIGVGDKVQLRTRASGIVEFTVAGVVWSPGVDVMVGIFDLGGQFEQRTAYSVFGSLEDARELFGVKELSVFAANLELGVEREELNKRLQQDLGKMGLQVFDIRQVKASIESGLGSLLLMASSVAFAALFVASLGVTNTVMASIRSRRWQFGVLRAVGVSRSQLLRLVLAESLLLSLAAAVLGLSCGAWLTLNSRHMSKLFVGLLPDVVIPWGIIGIGLAAVLFVALAASLYPAITTSRKPVLDLLQAGRAST